MEENYNQVRDSYIKDCDPIPKAVEKNDSSFESILKLLENDLSILGNDPNILEYDPYILEYDPYILEDDPSFEEKINSIKFEKESSEPENPKKIAKKEQNNFSKSKNSRKHIKNEYNESFIN